MNQQFRQELRERFLKLNTATVCDVFDEFEWTVIVFAKAEEIVQQEEEARRLSDKGMTAKEMLEKYGHV